jgi:hypothetical protein
MDAIINLLASHLNTHFNFTHQNLYIFCHYLKRDIIQKCCNEINVKLLRSIMIIIVYSWNINEIDHNNYVLNISNLISPYSQFNLIYLTSDVLSEVPFLRVYYIM